MDHQKFHWGLASSLVVIVLIICPHEWSAQAAESLGEVDFNQVVKPILSDKCFRCHGPDEAAREAQLQLDVRERAIEALESGHRAIVPGEPAESELLHRIESTDPDMVMPPPWAKLPAVTASEAQLLRSWIEQGAPWSRHWSLIPPDATTPSDVSDAAWVRGPIDRFIVARLDQAGLHPSPQARRETLIRRVSFDLTGLPPTPEEVDAFLHDESPEAYEKVVNRLLASPRYGEHLAVHWLDLARYADTYGYQVDQDRRVWPWRDWVIESLNRNMPYDQFVTWQLAGDLLPDPSDEKILATAFNRLHAQKAEGGSTEEEFRVEYVADRVNTFGASMLGLTVECARCHDHKYDPISQREYYQLFAFFDNIDEFGLYSYFTPSTPTPALLLATDEQKLQAAEIEEEVATTERELSQLAEEWQPEKDRWIKESSTGVLIPGLVAHFGFEEISDGKLAAFPEKVEAATSSDGNEIVPGRVGNALRLSGDDEVKTDIGNFTRNQPFSISLWLNTPDVKERAVVFHRSRAWTDAGSRGFQLLLEQGKLSASLIHFWPGNACRIRTKQAIETNKWHHVAMLYDGSSRADGIQIYVNGKLESCETVRDNLTKNITGGGQDFVAVGARFRDRGFKDGLVDELRIYDRRLTEIEVAELADGQSLQNLLAKPSGKLTDAERQALHDYLLTTKDDSYRKQLKRLKELRDERSKLVDAIPAIMVMEEMEQPRPTFLLQRGLYSAPGDPVAAQTPQALGELTSDRRHSRLELARWLTDPKHPLTARVAVNRFWQHFFGYGLVRTPEDFGSQGEPPTHPLLLDWLAKNFVDHGWDVKRLLKQMVMSATYRQRSTAAESLAAHDPENRLLARGPRNRLSAEAIRDNALYVSGLLVEKIGGPPARPYEVAVSFKPRETDAGEGLYRRSVYTHWQRTGPAPVMMAFDAPKRSVCTVKRERTSTPLQALVLLNDPQTVEAARIFAERMIRENGDDVGLMVGQMFRWLTSRQPNAAEQEILIALYEEQFEHFRNNEQSAELYVGIGNTARDESIAAPRLAAAALVVSALLNYDGCVTKW